MVVIGRFLTLTTKNATLLSGILFYSWAPHGEMQWLSVGLLMVDQLNCHVLRLNIEQEGHVPELSALGQVSN